MDYITNEEFNTVVNGLRRTSAQLKRLRSSRKNARTLKDKIAICREIALAEEKFRRLANDNDKQ